MLAAYGPLGRSMAIYLLLRPLSARALASSGVPAVRLYGRYLPVLAQCHSRGGALLCCMPSASSAASVGSSSGSAALVGLLLRR